MATIRLVPSTYYLSNSSYLTVANASNMYANTDSTTYGTVTNTRTSTSSYYIYLRGFNFSDVPSAAVVSNITIKIKGKHSGGSTGTLYCYDDTTQISSCGSGSAFGTSDSVITFSNTTVDWATLKGYGSDFGIRINCKRSSRNTQSVITIYGAEIEVTYTVPESRTVTSSLTGDGTISPSGSNTYYDGDTYALTITPDVKDDEITVVKDGTDVSSQIVPHYQSGTIPQTAGSYTTELSASGANFYTSSSTTGNYFNYAVGHTAESPGSTSTSYNTYVKDNGSNTATGWAIYTFDFSSIPNDAEIDSVQVKCYGACESTTHDSTHKAEVSLYSGSSQKGTTQNFSSTSNTIMTISDVGTWTRSELQNAKLYFTVAYYGGRLFGITWNVTYHVPGNPEYYTYSFTVSGNSDVDVTIGTIGEVDTFYVKMNGSWKKVTKAYKKVNGSWVLQTNLRNLFQSGVNYIQR